MLYLDVESICISLVSQVLGQQGNHVLKFYHVYYEYTQFDHDLIFCFRVLKFLNFSDCPALISYSQFLIKK